MKSQRQDIFHELVILRWKRGDRSAIDDLLAHWNTRLLYYIRRLVGNEADAWDVLQQTWLQVVRKLHTVRMPAALPAWLYKTARNAAMKHRRDLSHRHEDAPMEMDQIAGPDPDFYRDDAEAINNALDRLSPAHREVLTLYFMQDLGVNEIAELLSVAAGTVKSRLHYARLSLRSQLH